MDSRPHTRALSQPKWTSDNLCNCKRTVFGVPRFLLLGPCLCGQIKPIWSDRVREGLRFWKESLGSLFLPLRDHFYYTAISLSPGPAILLCSLPVCHDAATVLIGELLLTTHADLRTGEEARFHQSPKSLVVLFPCSWHVTPGSSSCIYPFKGHTLSPKVCIYSSQKGRELKKFFKYLTAKIRKIPKNKFNIY